METEKHTQLERRPLEELACVNPNCELYGQRGQANLSLRKTYGKEQIRYLRCRVCREEFSERKQTPLWNSKIAAARAISIAEHLAEGCSFKGTARLVRADPSTVRRLNRRLGAHAQAFHDVQVQDVEVAALQADERHGYVGHKGQQVWEAELIDPASKFVLAHAQGPREEPLFRRLLEEGARRLRNRHDLVLFTDGAASYATLFPEIFGTSYRPPRQGERGRFPQERFRIPRTLAHVQLIKHHQGRRLAAVEIRYTHGSRKRVHAALTTLGYTTPNTSAIERRNGTARLMSAPLVRKTLAFARDQQAKLALGWWALTVYNWSRSHRSLRQRLDQSQGKKSIGTVRPPWRSASPIIFFLSLRSSAPPATPQGGGDHLT